MLASPTRRSTLSSVKLSPSSSSRSTTSSRRLRISSRRAARLLWDLRVTDGMSGQTLVGVPDASDPVRLADDVEQDLVGAGADPVQADVAVDARDVVLVHVARAAVDLHALVGDLGCDLGGVELGH